jgi:RNA polymerase sigma-70 factor (ECF subfamily)
MNGEAAVRRLVAKARGDPEAFAALYDLYIDPVYAFAYRRLGSRSEAEDVTAETFLAALANLRRFVWRGGGFGAWLFRIARNECLDALKKRARAAPLPAEEAERAGAEPEAAAIERETVARLRQLVAGLPPPQLEAVLLKYGAGLSNREIAAATGRTPTAVSSLLNRALNKLREGLDEDHG